MTIDEVVVNHRPRVHGSSKYGISRTVRVVLDLVTVKFLLELLDAAAADLRPGRHGDGGLRVSSSRAGSAIQRLFLYRSIGDRPLLLLGILLIFTGVQLVTLGLLAEMQARTYHESQDKPIYVIRDVLEAPPAGVPAAALPARHP